jgi:hypothetical protein
MPWGDAHKCRRTGGDRTSGAHHSSTILGPHQLSRPADILHRIAGPDLEPSLQEAEIRWRHGEVIPGISCQRLLGHVGSGYIAGEGFHRSALG